MADLADTAVFSVQVSGARVTYDGQRLFDELDLMLPAGQWTCLLGQSGVGKSTLLRLVMGLVRHQGAGDPVACSDDLPLFGRAAYMAQTDLLLPWLSVIDNVTLGHRLRGGGHRATDVRDRARRLLTQVGLADVADQWPRTLSGGMRQRAAIARTLMEERPVVLMDEPFSALDAITRVRLQDLAARLLAGRTVLLVTHDPLEALRLGHRIHVMGGTPARLDNPIVPSGDLPRSVDDSALLATQGELLRRLAEASA